MATGLRQRSTSLSILMEKETLRGDGRCAPQRWLDSPLRRMRRRARQFTKGVVEPADLRRVFEHFERLDDGRMSLDKFRELVHDLRLTLSEKDVQSLFCHLTEDSMATGAYATIDEELEVSLGSPQGDEVPVNSSRDVALALTINVEQFLAGIRRHRFLRRIISHYTFPEPSQRCVAENYDYSQPTHLNYCAPVSDGYVGELVAIRERIDASWHGNYTRERQRWQDAAAHAVALPNECWAQPSAEACSQETDEPEPVSPCSSLCSDAESTHGESAAPMRNPWLVFTCGPMGAGKGWVMNWMSVREVLPLRRIVHIDPDRFKQMMPEWPGYARRDAESAGTMCHRESGLLAELAQELAIEQRQNVWVDGTLRDFEWYEAKLDLLRVKHPHYRVAIFYVHAKEEVVRQRVKSRAARAGGRDVPESVLAASIAAPAHALRALTPKVDFIARINNEGCDPVLEAFESVDTTGDWAKIAKEFGGAYGARASSKTPSVSSF